MRPTHDLKEQLQFQKRACFHVQPGMRFLKVPDPVETRVFNMVWLMSNRPWASVGPGLLQTQELVIRSPGISPARKLIQTVWCLCVLNLGQVNNCPETNPKKNIYKYSFSLNCYMGLAQASNNFNQGQSGPSPIKKLSALIYVAL